MLAYAKNADGGLVELSKDASPEELASRLRVEVFILVSPRLLPLISQVTSVPNTYLQVTDHQGTSTCSTFPKFLLGID